MSKNKARNNIEYKNKCPICKIVCIDQLMHVDGKEIPIHTYLCPTCGRMYGNSINHSYMEKMTIASYVDEAMETIKELQKLEK